MLNTNIVIALFAEEAAVQQRLAEANEVFVPSIVLGELYYGARKSVRVAGTDKTFVLYCSGRRVPCYEVRGD